MSKLSRFIKYWLPMLGWMCLIFGASADQNSFRHSYSIFAPLLHWLFPGRADSAIQNLIFYLRKCAHLTEYAILAWLIWRLLRASCRGDLHSWRWSMAGLALALAALYAATDEYHQTFVPSRQGSIEDVLLDTCGAAIGLTARYLVHRLYSATTA